MFRIMATLPQSPIRRIVLVAVQSRNLSHLELLCSLGFIGAIKMTYPNVSVDGFAPFHAIFPSKSGFTHFWLSVTIKSEQSLLFQNFLPVRLVWVLPMGTWWYQVLWNDSCVTFSAIFEKEITFLSKNEACSAVHQVPRVQSHYFKTLVW